MSYFKILLLLGGDIETNPGPDLTALYTKLSPAAPKWFSIGIQLRVDVSELHKFRRKHSEPSELLREVLKVWLEGKTKLRPSWENINKVLETPSVDELMLSLSNRLQMKHGYGLQNENKADEISSDMQLTALCSELSSVASKWFRIGIQLGVEVSQLHAFHQKHSKPSDHELLREVLKVWLEGKTKLRPSWENIIKVLEAPSVVDEQVRSLSKQLQMKYRYGLQNEDKVDEISSEIAAEGLDSFRPKKTFLPPALLYFPDGCAPSGTFSHLCANLISQCGWKRTDKLYRNCIKFCLGNEPGEVTIIDAFRWLEVYLEAPGDVALNICYGILQNIILGLETAHKALQMEKISYELAIMCPKQGQGKCKDSPHAAIVKSTTQYWICTENPKNDGVLVRKQSVWFSKNILLPGVSFISQATLTILNSKRDKLQTLEWENHGLKIHVPPGAIPDSDTQCEIDVGATFSGSFKFPEKHTLITPIFYIQPSKKLKKPVTLEIEHWCSINSEDDSKSLIPIFAQSSTKRPPYVFSPIKTKTTLNQNWGVFEVKTFSLFGLSWSSFLNLLTGWQNEVPRVPKAPPSVLYLGRVYYNSQSRRYLRVRLVITPHTAQHQKAVERVYTPDNWTFQTNFKFSFLEGNSILSIGIGQSGVTTDDGWLIRACNPPLEINKDEINECKDYEPANCELSAKWKSRGEPSLELDYFVPIKGVNREGFLLTISPDSIGPESRPPQSSVVPEVTAFNENLEKLSNLTGGVITTLANKAIGKSLLSDESWAGCICHDSPVKQVTMFLFYISSQIKAEPKNLDKFIKILKEVPTLVDVAGDIERSLAANL